MNLIEKMIRDAISYLNQTAGTDYSYSEERTITLLFELIKEGYSLEDFKTVILKKWEEWQGTKFQEFVRPSTLFGKNFKKYLHEQPRVKQTQFHKLQQSVDKAKQTDWKLGN
jgi:uncharacterized phage protein (TIGR02220 family)